MDGTELSKSGNPDEFPDRINIGKIGLRQADAAGNSDHLAETEEKENETTGRQIERRPTARNAR
jgi:hypothetical protein